MHSGAGLPWRGLTHNPLARWAGGTASRNIPVLRPSLGSTTGQNYSPVAGVRPSLSTQKGSAPFELWRTRNDRGTIAYTSMAGIQSRVGHLERAPPLSSSWLTRTGRGTTRRSRVLSLRTLRLRAREGPPGRLVGIQLRRRPVMFVALNGLEFGKWALCQFRCADFGARTFATTTLP